jgi:hypothetical protein
MTKTEFQALADIRVKDAETLFEAGNYDGAYYLIGYAVECALKACIAKQFKQDDIPDHRFVQNVFTHNLNDLLGHAGLKAELQKMAPSSPIRVSWGVVSNWSERERYNSGAASQKASDLITAVVDRNNGVLPWLKTYW